jgi:hypothetical protein
MSGNTFIKSYLQIKFSDNRAAKFVLKAVRQLARGKGNDVGSAAPRL